MVLPEFDFKLGQLALARGMVELWALLECVSKAGERGITLRQALLDEDYLTEEQSVRLQEALEEMSAEEVKDVVDSGETIAMRTLVEQTQEEARSDAQKLSKAIAVSDTLDAEPPSLIGSEDDDVDWSSPEFESRYEFLEELGRGGMGKIMRVEDRGLQREIALKMVLPDTELSQPQRRLVAEARLTGQLEHPSIIPVYELGELADGEPYYTMQVVTERSLETILSRMRDGASDVPSLLQLVQIIRQVCLAIQYAHERGIIHRDLKPENVLVGEYGEVFVIDWGIAKVVADVDRETPSPTLEGEEQTGELVGTPQYMAPEQAGGEHGSVDERTDVYALGAMLYEIMTLEPVFDSPTVLGLLVAISGKEPVPPSERAPDRDIPVALQEICLCAISKQPRDRYASAQKLAEELELFIEGVKEREKKLAHAQELIEQAHQSRKKYNRAREELVQAMDRRDELRASTPPWADEGERAAIWEAEYQVEQLEIEVERQFGKTVQLLEQSLGHASLEQAHVGLASLYWERFEEAEQRGDRPTAAYFENLVRQHDTGAFTDRLRGLADLSVELEPPGAQLVLSRVTEQHRRLIPSQTVATTTGSLQIDGLEHGRYRLSAKADGYAPVQTPVVLKRLASVDMRIQLRSRQEIPDDFVLIPGGEFLTGSARETGPAQRAVELDAYAIKRTPVTCGEYVEFLNAVASCDLDRAKRHAPRPAEDASSYFPIVDGRFVVPEVDSEGDSWSPEWPICMISHDDAVAYARWRRQRDGLSYRLPTEQQWEKAARGIDGRLYPWGNHFDPSFCKMRDSERGKPMPAPVGSFVDDTSPFGVLDMAGNVSEWTSTEHADTPGTYVLCGGSYNSPEFLCRLTWRMQSPASYRHTHYGFRLVLELNTDSPR